MIDVHTKLYDHDCHTHDELTMYTINSSNAGIDIVDGRASRTFNDHNVNFDFELQSRLRELGSLIETCDSLSWKAGRPAPE